MIRYVLFLVALALCTASSTLCVTKSYINPDEYFQEVTYYKMIKRIPPVEFHKKTVRIKKKRSIHRKR